MTVSASELQKYDVPARSARTGAGVNVSTQWADYISTIYYLLRVSTGEFFLLPRPAQASAGETLLLGSLISPTSTQAVFAPVSSLQCSPDLVTHQPPLHRNTRH